MVEFFSGSALVQNTVLGKPAVCSVPDIWGRNPTGRDLRRIVSVWRSQGLACGTWSLSWRFRSSMRVFKRFCTVW